MTFNNNNQPQVDYLLVKQLIIKFRDSSFLNTLRQCWYLAIWPFGQFSQPNWPKKSLAAAKCQYSLNKVLVFCYLAKICHWPFYHFGRPNQPKKFLTAVKCQHCSLRVGLSEYNADNLGEKDIVDTIKHTAGDDFAPYENLLSEFRGVFSTFGMKNLTKLYHFLYIALMCSQHFQLLFGQRVDDLYDSLVTSSQQTNYASSSTENASSDMEIFAYPEH
ncbi:unnamed protein product [Rhizophagus irregularis]|nr:unnamed protein product [Rhizophagus irregularis]